MFKRNFDRKWDEPRTINITNNYLKHAASVFIEFGNTKVLCTASLGDKTAPFLKNTGKGWLTAEYSMLPMSTETRTAREVIRGHQGGRTHEIQRLIGRSLRAVTDLTAFSEKTIYIDCDVIQADGGTRTASITGAFVALVDLFRGMQCDGLVEKIPLRDYVSAISVGIVNEELIVDLEYEEDSKAEVDMNFVMTGSGLFIEVQGTAEHMTFDREQLNLMTEVAVNAIKKITSRQKEVVGNWQP